jgi:ribosomal protein S18 acetylase RimI-like enzyme
VVDIAGYTRADLEALERLRTAVRAADGDVWLPGPGRDEPADPQGRCLVARLGRRLVGYGWLDWWTEVDGTHLFLLPGVVTPAARGRGVGTALLAAQQQQARKLAGQLGMTPVTFGGNADENQPGSRELLLDNGFRPAFTVLEMACGRFPAGPPPALPAGLELRPVRSEHHPRIHAALEESFAGSGLGYIPRSHGEYLADVAHSQSRLELWCVAWDGAEVAGVVINTVRPDRTGETPWVAVRPAWRRRGLALALLGHSLARLAAAGVSCTTLRTVAENPQHSQALYERAGYQVTQRFPRYRKPA